MIIIFTLLFLSAKSQVKKAIFDSTHKPVWVKMMNDPNTNYFQAVDSFNAYWKDKQKPMSEHELFSQVTDVKRAVILKSPHSPEIESFVDYKAFLNWQKRIAPYVQDDGSILPMSERLEIWKQQQAAIAQQKAQQKK